MKRTEQEVKAEMAVVVSKLVKVNLDIVKSIPSRVF